MEEIMVNGAAVGALMAMLEQDSAVVILHVQHPPPFHQSHLTQSIRVVHAEATLPATPQQPLGGAGCSRPVTTICEAGRLSQRAREHQHAAKNLKN